MTLTEEYFGGREAALDVRAQIVVEDDGKDILNQYIVFSKVFDQQVKRHGRTAEALTEAIRICVDQDVLREYLKAHEREVVDMMLQYYTQKQALDEYVESERVEAARRAARLAANQADKKTAKNLHAKGLTDEMIASIVERNLETVREWLYPKQAQ